MQYGVYQFCTEYSGRPDDLAREVEQRGFESLWLPEHTHIPVSRGNPHPYFPGGGELPRQYWHLYDPFVALTAAAVATTSLKLGTGICLLIQRDPIITAKAVASLDQLSNGRFIFGVAAGWNAEEMANHGTDFRQRHRVLRENLLAMKEIWTREEAEYHGQLVDFDPIWSHPKPVQQPHPPIIMGGSGARTYRQIVEFCDGWMPTMYHASRPDLAERIGLLRQRAAEAGREPSSLSVTIFGCRPDPDFIAAMERAGVDRVLFGLPSRERDEVLPLLDQYTELMR